MISLETDIIDNVGDRYGSTFYDVGSFEGLSN
jgi:hypothetical protein